MSGAAVSALIAMAVGAATAFIALEIIERFKESRAREKQRLAEIIARIDRLERKIDGTLAEGVKE